MAQITRAMEMVAASKMRRAQDRVTSGRPYSERLREVLGDLSSLQLDAEQLQEFPLLAQREIRKTAIILITPDRGLSGALNANILRRAVQYIRNEAVDGRPQVIAVGKKGLVDGMAEWKPRRDKDFTKVPVAELGRRLQEFHAA